MREVLFRGKYKISGEWVYGDLAHHDKGSVFIRCWRCGTYANYEIDPETVCQYTGLTDKNGRKIFEGDIVKIPYEHLEDSICKVVFNHGMFIGELLDGCEESMQRSKGDIEVIGNIFDNPGLLKGAKPT